MKITPFVLALLLTVFSPLGMTHGDGHHFAQLSDEKIIAVARVALGKLSAMDHGLALGDLDESWKNIKAENLSIDERGHGYTIVKAQNPKEKGAVYVLISEAGELYDVNRSGKFKGIN